MNCTKLVLFLALTAHILAQAPAASPNVASPTAASPNVASPNVASLNEQNILTYIHGSWSTLSRSMSDCKSLVDPKISTAPILYLPAGMPTPKAVEAAQSQCRVQVEHLPRPVTQMGAVRPEELPKPGLLYLPNPYVVPGGRFNEMYGWDSYFILLGLVHDQQTSLARGMVENFFFEIENYGAVLNANRTYFFTRSQPPFLSSMIRAVYELQASGSPLDRDWLARAYTYAVRDHALWLSPPHRAGDTGLARYFDLGDGPVPEMADDSGYYPDVIRWFLAHPGQSAGSLLDAPDEPTSAQAAALASTSCNIAKSKVCAQAHVDGHRLTSAFYHGDRAMRESGFDTTFRFGPFSAITDHLAPVCLNSLLYKYELDLAHFATLLGKPSEATQWQAAAAARKAAIDKYLWNSSEGLYFDYDFITGKPSTYKYISTFYPLWSGAASPAQAAAVARHLSVFAHPGGLAMSDTLSGVQWDDPFGWAPTNWLAIDGLARNGFRPQAEQAARAFNATVLQNFLADGTIREKYNVVDGSANIKVAAGYKSNVVGFGWTNGVYLQLHDLLTTASPSPNHQAQP